MTKTLEKKISGIIEKSTIIESGLSNEAMEALRDMSNITEDFVSNFIGTDDNVNRQRLIGTKVAAYLILSVLDALSEHTSDEIIAALENIYQ